jgi:rhomboid family GlyGly-CTERM serine protease
MQWRSLIQIVSQAERLAVCGAGLLLVLQAADVGAALEYRRGLLAAEPWRLITAHLVHVGWRHAAVNAVAWLAVARLFAAELPALRQLALVGACAIGISLALWLTQPQLDWYRGASGVLHGLFAAAALEALLAARQRTRRGAADRWLPALLLAGVWLKILAEQRTGGTPAPAAWLGAAVVTRAHLAGAICGSMALLAMRALRRADPGPGSASGP